ncbi:hypothetical protein CDL15_Pgr027571 [Punica granatum]|uniref:Polygalacturonase-like n=1 Tax=Punica granatum TaxID=22663 RepID=A0A218XIP3_PUNGR|nr:hypothetical protein CDL15_Pgr027571 [Punica granatum]
MAKLTKCVAFSALFFFFFFLHQRPLRANGAKYNVVALGAIQGSKTGSSEAFLRAWKSACESKGPSIIYVPSGRFLLEKSIEFAGPCKGGPIGIRIDGSLVAPSDYKVIGSAYSWLSFHNVDGVYLSGGTLDGQGTGLWKCKASSDSDCPSGASTLLFSNSKNIIISRLTSLNSQMFHIVINRCENVKMQGVKVFADGESPNTDGIHVQYSSDVTILNSRIATGDDCISITQGTSNVWVEDILCGPGHGISVGSLGKTLEEEGVENVTDSGVEVSNITYEDIRGTSATRVALKFDCSTATPCTGIQLKNVNLTFKDKPAETLCVNANGTAEGQIQPSNCLGL